MEKTGGGNLEILSSGHQSDIERGDDLAVVMRRQHRECITTVQAYETFVRQNSDNVDYENALKRAKKDLVNFEKELKKQLEQQRQDLVATIKSLEDLVEVEQDPENDKNKEALAQAKTDLAKLEIELKQLK